MAVGWLLPPGQSVRSVLPWVAPIARTMDADSLDLFWIERVSTQKSTSTDPMRTKRSNVDMGARQLPLAAASLPNEVEPLIRSLDQSDHFDAPSDLTLEAEGSKTKRDPAGGVDTETTEAPSFRDVPWAPLGEGETNETQSSIPVSIVSVRGTDWSRRILDQIEERRISQLVVPRAVDSQTDGTAQQLEAILSDAHCELFQLQIGESTLKQQVDSEADDGSDVDTSTWYVNPRPQVVVAAGEGGWSRLAIRRAYRLAQVSGAELTAVYVEPDVDDFATQAGYEILQSHLGAALGNSADDVKRRVVLNDNIADGLAQIANQYDLMLVGSRHHGRVLRWFQKGVAEQLLRHTQVKSTSLAVVRVAAPIGTRIFATLENVCRNTVPQLERERRVALVQRIQSSSQWDFDFVALICLSTLIATCGLLQSSAPVVIGAMLVAPLMTPLLAAGLSLVQGNPVLLKNGLLSVLRGFLLALALAISIGCVMRSTANAEDLSNLVTAEIAARGNPRILDLIVALVSGIAAAYASGRPNLLSALPGVAIASALVPPIAALGLAAAWGQWQLALGAGLLFLTNIVAIVLGTAYAFWAVGIRGAARRGFMKSQTWRAMVALTLILIGLGVIESLPARRIPVEVRQRIAAFAEAYPELHVERMEWASHRADELIVHIQSNSAMTRELAQQLAFQINRGRSNPIQLQLRTQLVTHVNHSP